MAEHDPLFSPSASARWLSCTASANLLKDLPRSVSEVAAEGTVAHEVFADRLRGLALPSLPYPVKDDGFDITIDQDMVDYVDEAIAYVRGLGPGVLLVEQRVEAVLWDHITIPGTSDVILQPDAEPHTLHVCDLKYGKGVKVYAPDNSQMKLYAAGSIHTHGLLFDSIDEVTVHVLQPRLDHYDSWTISTVELARWMAGEVANAVAEVLDGPGVFRPSTTACRWCPLSGNCAAQAKHAIEEFEDVVDDPVALPPAQLAGYLARFKELRAFMHAAEARAEHLLLDDPAAVPGWKMVAGRSTRQWPQDVEPHLLQHQHEYADKLDTVYQPAKLLSPAMLEKRLGKKTFATSPFVELVVKPPGKPALVPESDPRPVYQETVAEQFEVLE